jgi:hypothetical protein
MRELIQCEFRFPSARILFWHSLADDSHLLNSGVRRNSLQQRVGLQG